MKIMSGLLAAVKWSVCTVKSQRILQESFSVIPSGWCTYYFDLTWIPFTLQISQWICLPIQSCLLLYSLGASLGHSLATWLVVSSALLHILHFVCLCDLSIFPLITLVQMACSWAANIIFSFHTLWSNFAIATYSDSLLPLFVPRNCSFFFCFLASIVISRIGSIKSVSTDFVAVSKRSLESYVVLWSYICQFYCFFDALQSSATLLSRYVEAVNITFWMKCIMRCHRLSSSSI